MIIVIPALFVVNNMLQLLVISCSEDKVLIDEGVEVVDFNRAFYVTVFKNRVQSHGVISKLC
jgi:hypothetical protein